MSKTWNGIHEGSKKPFEMFTNFDEKSISLPAVTNKSLLDEY
jgi:hypothetical protein